jgi:phospholipase/lecithinase/hemolysin
VAQEKAMISYQVILGDSLSDGGQLQHSKPLLAGVTDLPNSPYGRFTDGFTWADDLARSAALDVLKEQFIRYIINAVQPEKLDNPAIEIENFKTYIRAIDLEKFHPDTFSFEKLKDSYLKRHLLKERCLAYLSNLFASNGMELEEGNAFLDYLKSMPLERFHPDTFDLNHLLDSYRQIASNKQNFISPLDELIKKRTLSEMVTQVKQTYKTAPKHHNNIFDAIDYDKFDVRHLNENIRNFLYGSFSLGDYRRVLFQGHNFVRRFAEGGLSAYHYPILPDTQTFSLILKQIKYTIGEFQLSFKYLASFVGQFFVLLGKIIGARATLSSLEEMTRSLLKDDKVQRISQEQKSQTLVTEWTGANDFITMNAFSSEEICNNAITQRIDNILKLANAGYKNFLLVDLPDLGKTPRYLKRSEEERTEATRLVNYFNQKLHNEIQTTLKNHPELDIQLFPLSERFDVIYNNPESYGLPKNINKTDPLLSINPKDVDENGYMFWDDVHPSNLMHHALAQEVYRFYQQNYNLQPPVEIAEPCCPLNVAKGLLVMFKDKYTREYDDYSNQLINLSRFFGLGANKQRFSDINFEPASMEQAKLSLAKLYQVSKHDQIVKQSMIHMGWLQKDGQIPKEGIAPMLEQAYNIANQSVAKECHPPTLYAFNSF